MRLEQTIHLFQSKGFRSWYEIRFDSLIDLEVATRYRTEELASVEPIPFDRTDAEGSTYLFAATSLDGQRGLILVDLQHHQDPISVDLMDLLELPNPAR